MNDNTGLEFDNITAAVAAAKSGNNDGFTYLYNSTYQKSYYTAVKYMKNDDAAADVVQEAYMRAFQNISMLQEDGKFSGWMGMIVANTAKNHLKKKNPVLFSEMDIENGEDAAIEFQDTIMDERTDFRPEEHYSKVEISELVNELLNSLPEEQRMCMIMYYLDGLSIEEIASALECNKNTVTSRLNYGRKKIKAKGDELEKRGYKLYSVSPVVLLTLLLSSEMSGITVIAALGGVSTGTTTVTTASTTTAPANGSASVGTGTTASGKAAAKTSFLATTAGKVIAAFAGLAIVGGITAGISLGIGGNKDKKDKKDDNTRVENITTEDGGLSTTEATGTDDLGTTESTGTEDLSSNASTDIETDHSEILLTYLENELVPKYGIYDPTQMYVEYGPDGFPNVFTFEYDKDSQELIMMQTDVYDMEGLLANYYYDYSGICYAQIDDYDNDDKPELLIIRGTGDTTTSSGSKADNRYVAEMYHVENDKAVLTANTILSTVYVSADSSDVNENYNISKIYTETINDQKCLLIGWWKPHSDVSQNDSLAIISLKDLSYISYLKGTMIQNAQEMYSLYTDFDVVSGETKEYRANYSKVGDDWVGEVGFGSASDEFLKSIGYMNETTKEIFHICMLTDVAREYLIGGDTDKEDAGQDDKGQDDMNDVLIAKTAEEVMNELENARLDFRISRYGLKGIQFTGAGTCEFLYTDHEPYAGEEEGYATASVSGLTKVDEYSYSFTVSQVKDLYTEHVEEVKVEDPTIEGGSYIFRHVFHELAPEAEGEYIIYVPGTPRSMIPENVEIGAGAAFPNDSYIDKDTNEITDYVIYKKGSTFAYFIER